MKKSESLLAILAAVVAFGFVSQPADAAQIGGAVYDAAGNAIPGATVTIQQVDVRRGYAARALSGRGGIFLFNNVPAGRYIVSTVTRRGSVRIEVAVRADGAVRVRLVLPAQRRRPGGDER